MSNIETVAVAVNRPRRSEQKERYDRVNNAWGQDRGSLPALTEAEAISAAKRLWRIATGKKWPGYKIRFTSGNRYTRFSGRELSINVAWHNNPSHGWRDLVHVISHKTLRIVRPGHDDHGTAHASHEYTLIQEVIKRGWLEGKLKRPEKPKPERNVKAERHERVLARIVTWESKLKRARTALKKLHKQRAYYERAMTRH